MTMSDDTMLILEELKKTDSDRSTGILGAALVEDALGDWLRKVLVGSKKSKDALLNGGLLSDSRARSDMLYRFGKLAKRTYQNTIWIQEIRNKFAHRGAGSNKSPRDLERCGPQDPRRLLLLFKLSHM